MLRNLLLILLLICSTYVKAQVKSAQRNITWGDYVTTNIPGYGNTLLQVTVEGGNSVWNGLFFVNGGNAWTPSITWNNVKLISFSGYNTGTDDVQVLLMSTGSTSSFEPTTIVLKTGTPTNSWAAIKVVATGYTANSLDLTGSSSPTIPYPHTMASSAKTFNLWTVNDNVGIGTNSPSEKLEIAGSSYINGESAGYIVDFNGLKRVGFMKYQGREGGIWRTGSQDFEIGRVNVETLPGNPSSFQTDLYVSGNGNVGIATSDPQTRLEVSGIVRLTPNTNSYLQLGRFSTTEPYGYISSASVSWGGVGLKFETTNGDNAGGVTRMTIDKNGKVGIGTTNTNDPDFRLFVEQGIRTRKVKVDQTTWPDYVFEPTYKLPSLAEVEAFIKANKHLPEVPSAKEVEVNGVDLGENQAALLKKIEEQMLYILQLNKQLEKQQNEMRELKKVVQTLNEQIKK